jgi:tetratricopeptide (TPR) repeat protein
LDEQTRTETSSVADALENARNLLASHPSAAAKQARAIIQAEPAIAEAYVLLSCGLRALGQPEEAQEAEQRGLAVADGNPVIIRAREQVDAGELLQADTLLHLYLADTPNDPVAIYLRAQVQTKAGKLRDARRLLGRTLALAPSFGAAHAALAALPVRPADPARTDNVPTILEDEAWFTNKPASSSENR